MGRFAETLISGKTQNYFKAFRTSGEFRDSLLAPDYNIARWRNDPEVERDHKTFFRSLSAKSPHLQDRPSTDLEVAGRTQVFVDGQEAIGFGAAYCIEGIAISLQSEVRWESAVITVKVVELTLDGDLHESTQTVRHVSEVRHWTQHQPWIESQSFKDVGNGVEVIRHASELFPHLDFCGKSIQQLTRLSGQERYFSWVIRSLMEANSLCASWDGGPFRHELLSGPATGESESVLNNPELRGARVFKKPNGQYELFEFHMKNHAENKRIHYLLDTESKRILIGYIGDHLPV